MATPKEAATQIIDHLPDQATWDDIMYELYERSSTTAKYSQPWSVQMEVMSLAHF